MNTSNAAGTDAGKVAVIIPCYNEELTVGKVVRDFKEQLPAADLIVFDNQSQDRTVERAKDAGARVVPAPRPGKGSVVRKAFREIDADLYLLVDGDDTYPAEDCHKLLAAVRAGADMAVGDRISHGHYSKENKRPFHNLGNAIVCKSINLLFGTQIRDAMSGYRAMSRRFVKNCPILVDGFAIETAMTIHAIDKLFRVEEIPVAYRDRPAGSVSKLNTFSDGIIILRSILWIFKDSKPLIFFGALALLQFLAFGGIAIYQFAGKGRDPFGSPLGIGLLGTAVTTLCAGFVLDTMAKHHREEFETNLMKENP